jgi:hypothetical protein
MNVYKSLPISVLRGVFSEFKEYSPEEWIEELHGDDLRDMVTTGMLNGVRPCFFDANGKFGKRKSACTHWLEGRCVHHKDMGCKWQHACTKKSCYSTHQDHYTLQSVMTEVARGKVCTFFLEGSCHHKSNCKFLHMHLDKMLEDEKTTHDWIEKINMAEEVEATRLAEETELKEVEATRLAEETALKEVEATRLAEETELKEIEATRLAEETELKEIEATKKRTALDELARRANEIDMRGIYVVEEVARLAEAARLEEKAQMKEEVQVEGMVENEPLMLSGQELKWLKTCLMARRSQSGTSGAVVAMIMPL